MGRELILFMKSLWYGSFLLILYDCLRILRRVFRHSSGMVAFEDLVFWIGSGFFLFSRIYQENSGALRAYLFVGAAVGVLAWHYSLSSYFVIFLSKWLRKIKEIIEIPMRKVLILVKRLKFWAVGVRISLYTRMKAIRVKGEPEADQDRGAKHGEKKRRQKREKRQGKKAVYPK